MTLNAATGIISGTPTTPHLCLHGDRDGQCRPGQHRSAAYAMTVNPAPVQTSFAFSPAGGALHNAMVAEDYRQSISATGGQGALLYSLQSGNLPKGITLNISTGELTGRWPAMRCRVATTSPSVCVMAKRDDGELYADCR